MLRVKRDLEYDDSEGTKDHKSIKDSSDRSPLKQTIVKSYLLLLNLLPSVSGKNDHVIDIYYP